MEYFVNAENTTYNHWQLELLVGSFNYNKLQDKLTVALSESDSLSNYNFTKNLFQHKKLSMHANVGQLREFPEINSLYCLAWAVENNQLSQPFAVLKPHMVIQQEPQLEFSSYPEVIFNPDHFFTFNNIIEHVGQFWEWFAKDREYYEKKWVPMGSIVIFNNIPSSFFARTISIAETLAVRQLMNGRKIWSKTIELALAINLSDYFSKITIRGQYSLSTNMLGNSNNPFIDFEHGLPPVFNKSMFKFSPPNYSSFGDPFEILAQHEPTPAAHFISILAKENLKSRNFDLQDN